MEWLGIEIHPDTPSEGMPIERLFRSEDTRRMMQNLRTLGAPYGIVFADITRISNSRMALQAAEHSKEQGRFDDFHGMVLQAYFGEAMDIGNREVILQLAADAGLDLPLLEQALERGTYLPRLREMQNEASLAGVTGVPTFQLGGRRTIVGVQAIEVFRNTLRSLGDGSS